MPYKQISLQTGCSVAVRPRQHYADFFDGLAFPRGSVGIIPMRLPTSSLGVPPERGSGRGAPPNRRRCPSRLSSYHPCPGCR
jgi:hypothetical protein